MLNYNGAFINQDYFLLCVLLFVTTFQLVTTENNILHAFNVAVIPDQEIRASLTEKPMKI